MAKGYPRTISISLDTDISALPMLVQARIWERLERAKTEIIEYIKFGHSAELLRLQLAGIIGEHPSTMFGTHTTKGAKKDVRMGAYKALTEAGYTARQVSGVLLMCERSVRNYEHYIKADAYYTGTAFVQAYQLTKQWASQ